MLTDQHNSKNKRPEACFRGSPYCKEPRLDALEKAERSHEQRASFPHFKDCREQPQTRLLIPTPLLMDVCGRWANQPPML